MNFDKTIQEMRDDMVVATQELIRIKSTQGETTGELPFGKGMDDALDYVLKLAADMGFTTKKLDGYCGYAEYGEGDIYIGVFGHVDVNEENVEDWKHDPYGGIVEKDRIYGCSAIDKGALIAAIFALKAIKETAGRLKRKVRLIVGTDERRYYADMKRYMEKENPPIAGITLDGHFPVTYAEKGLAMMEYARDIAQDDGEYVAYIRGGKLDNLVPGYCSARLVTERRSEIVARVNEYTQENRKDINARILADGVLLEAFGKERHCASIEKGINAIAVMLDFLRDIGFGSSDMKAVIEFLCTRIGFDIYGESMGIAYEDEFSGKTLMNFGILDMEKGRASLRLDCRFPISCNFVQALENIREHFEKAGFVEMESTAWPPTYFPQNHFLITALLECYREVTGDDSEAVVSNSASYSKVMPNIAAFGAHYPGEGIAWDQKDEYLEIHTLERTAVIYANAIYKLCTEV